MMPSPTQPLPRSSHPRSSLSEISFTREEITPIQAQTDGLISGFVRQATEWQSLAAMVAGGAFYRLGRIGVLGLSSQPAGASLQILSHGAGLVSEVTAFELSHRALLSLDANHAPSSSRTFWQGWRSSLVNFGLLRMGGAATRGQNVFVQHLFQDAGMVAGNQLGSQWGLTPAPEGDLAAQFLQAEGTLWQLNAGMSLVHAGLPHFSALERNLDLESEGRSLASHSSPEPILSPQPAGLAGRGGHDHLREAFSSSLWMAIDRDSSEFGAGPDLYDLSSGEVRGEPPASEAEQREEPTPPLSAEGETRPEATPSLSSEIQLSPNRSGLRSSIDRSSWPSDRYRLIGVRPEAQPRQAPPPENLLPRRTAEPTDFGCEFFENQSALEHLADEIHHLSRQEATMQVIQFLGQYVMEICEEEIDTGRIQRRFLQTPHLLDFLGGLDRLITERKLRSVIVFDETSPMHDALERFFSDRQLDRIRDGRIEFSLAQVLNRIIDTLSGRSLRRGSSTPRRGSARTPAARSPVQRNRGQKLKDDLAREKSADSSRDPAPPSETQSSLKTPSPHSNPATWEDFREGLQRVRNNDLRRGDLPENRAQATYRLFYSIQALQGENIEPSVALEALDLFALFVRNGQSFRAFLPLVKIARTSAIQERLIGLAQEGEAALPVIRRTEQLIRELNGAPGLDLARLLSAYAALRQLLGQPSATLDPPALLESFDAFEVALQTGESFYKVLARQRRDFLRRSGRIEVLNRSSKPDDERRRTN